MVKICGMWLRNRVRWSKTIRLISSVVWSSVVSLARGWTDDTTGLWSWDREHGFLLSMGRAPFTKQKNWGTDMNLGNSDRGSLLPSSLVWWSEEVLREEGLHLMARFRHSPVLKTYCHTVVWQFNSTLTSNISHVPRQLFSFFGGYFEVSMKKFHKIKKRLLTKIT